MMVSMPEEDVNSWNNRFREWRHNPCIMRPTTALIVLVVCLFWGVAFVLRFPTIVLGILIGPLLARFQWAVEFLYPMGIGRWAHLMIIRMAEKSRRPKADDANYGFHSRAMETRIEVVKGRVYVHPLPQLLDNLGYLVVCLPPKKGKSSLKLVSKTSKGDIKVDETANEENSIVAFVVDCGDAKAVARQISIISELHYHKQTIKVQSILSTHKHHDHTAGNKAFFNDKVYGKDIKLVFGGAIEEVPCCNFPLTNGDFLPLPKSGNNDMADVVEVETVAVPAHTRGSLAFVLRPITGGSNPVSVFLFTGDTMFCGGGGVPFEADIEPQQESKVHKMTASSFIKASASLYAVERCFAEILFRSVKHERFEKFSSDRLLVFPGHEYTNELLSRQMFNSESSFTDSCKWKNFSPAVFFETASHLYVSSHRRSLPHSSGKLLCVPSSVRTEILINPYLRNLKTRGEIIITALKQWNRNWSSDKVSEETDGAYGVNDTRLGSIVKRTPEEATPSSESRWNLNADSINESTFTTVYSADLDEIINDLSSGDIDPTVAARKLKYLKTNLFSSTVTRRPIPGTLPSDKSIYKALLGFALLGSAPAGLTLTDSETMKVPPPIISSSDRIRVSKKRLIAVLYYLGLLDYEHCGKFSVAIIHKLWSDAIEYSRGMSDMKDLELKESTNTPVKLKANESGDSENQKASPTDVESSCLDDTNDEVELGVLKWILFGIPEQRQSAFSKICKGAVGCPAMVEEVNEGTEQIQVDPQRPTLYSYGMSPENDQDDEEKSEFIEVESLSKILQEV